MAIKHSKFKNTGLLFELLVRQIAADTLENKDSKAVGILKKYFSKTELSKEYGIYKSLSTDKHLNESKGNILIESAILSQKKLSQSKLNKEKYSLISAIKESYNIDEFFKAKIDNYKILASIYLLFESNSSEESINPEIISDYKFVILENLTRGQKDKEKNEILEEFNNSDKETKLLIYKILVGKFNDKYKDSLNERQKNLLKEYIQEVSMTPKLRDYVNEELNIIRAELKKSIHKVQDKATQIKIKQVAEIIKEIPKTKSVTDDDISNLFNYYQLVEEINNISK